MTDKDFINKLKVTVNNTNISPEKNAIIALGVVQDYAMHREFIATSAEMSEASKVVNPIDSELIGQNLQAVPLQKFDIIREFIGKAYHYAIVYKVDKIKGVAWVVPFTSDLECDMAKSIKNSRIFKTFYIPYFAPVFLNKNTYKFITIFDNKNEANIMFKEAKTILKPIVGR